MRAKVQGRIDLEYDGGGRPVAFLTVREDEPAVRGDGGKPGVSQPVSVDLKKAEALVA
jgi:hypothetical protein